MKIYGERLNRTERVLWAADECGLEYEHIPVQVVLRFPSVDENISSTYSCGLNGKAG